MITSMSHKMLKIGVQIITVLVFRVDDGGGG